MKKIRTIYIAVSLLIILLGVIHLSVTPFLFSELSESTFWFLSAGLTGILLGFLNFAVIRTGGKDRIVKRLGIVANFLASAFSIGGSIFVERSIQGFIGTFLLIVLFFLSIYFRAPHHKIEK